MRTPIHLITTAALVNSAFFAASASAADALTPLKIRQVKVRGEIGRRIERIRCSSMMSCWLPDGGRPRGGLDETTRVGVERHTDFGIRWHGVTA